MGLIDSLPSWLGGRPPRAAALPCPTEADILNYAEQRLSAPARHELEQHFAACDDCRGLLVLLARFPEAEITELPPPSSAEVQQQTARVMQLFEESERRNSATAGNPSGSAPRLGWAYRFRVPLAAAALVICALLAGGVYLMMRNEPASAAARQSLQLAMKDERRSAARLSGGFDYSPYKPTRGSNDSPDFHLNRALGELRAAASDSANPEMRQMLARAHLAFDRPEHARQAQAILNSLRARGIETAELYNDLGVAQFQLQNNDAAITSFSRALEINPAYSEALFNRALAYESAARYAEARRDWQQFIDSAADARWKTEAASHLAALANYSIRFQ
ncbi:MAG TPA: tetratricopeptide repeat protein [Blastocatellia bacterium]|nr:tetratricopeptide repeat protein [Blastocatellia bacterium]